MMDRLKKALDKLWAEPGYRLPEFDGKAYRAIGAIIDACADLLKELQDDIDSSDEQIGSLKYRVVRLVEDGVDVVLQEQADLLKEKDALISGLQVGDYYFRENEALLLRIGGYEDLLIELGIMCPECDEGQCLKCAEHEEVIRALKKEANDESS